MKILNLSDLHMHPKDKYFSRKKKFFSNLVKKHQPDVVVLAGDIFEGSVQDNPYFLLNDIFGSDIPLVCVWGNHEFYYKTPAQTRIDYQNWCKEAVAKEIYNIHYLDLENYFVFSQNDRQVAFVGNILSYDGSMKDVSTQDMTAWRKYEWLDYLIESWKDEWLPYCERCKQEIKDNIKVVRETNGKETTIILVTHHVPHEKLNLHASPHFYNAYSGVKNFLGELRREGFGVDYAICGHTHRRNVGAMIEGTLCVNVGDSNLYPYEHFVFEI